MSENSSLYPGKARVKVFYVDDPLTRDKLISIVKNLFPEVKADAISTKTSTKQTYAVLSIDLYVETEDQLKELYLEFKNHPEVKMVL